MHVLGRTRGAMNAGLVVLALLIGAIAPSPVQAKPEPGYKPGSGFRLFARASFRWIGNRTQCFLSASGQICTAESSTVGGGYWPANTANQYIFNTGLQIAGIVDSASAGNSWAGNIEGAFFFNARGGGNGQQITQIYNSADPADLAAWPTEAYVPSGADLSASLYNSALQGAKTASDNDIWFLSWEGDPNLAGGRGHPLGIMVETRGLAYTTPGKNDMLFFIYTFYNVSASDPLVYASAPARLRTRLQQTGALFQQLNSAKGAVLPAAGYTIKNMYLAFGADMDVTFNGSGSNFDGVNVPFALGYTYHSTFTADPAWSFTDATIYNTPFFKGAGFIGVKYLKSPEVNGQQVGLTLFGATTNGGEFSDPRNTQALFRYLSGTPDPSQGDDQCNVGDVAVTKICYINQGTPADMRFFQSSGPLTLGPGEYSSIAVAYIFAAPVATGACTGPDVCGQVTPQSPTNDLTRLTNPAVLPLGANTLDSITGFRGWRDTTFQRGGQTVLPNGLVDQEEFRVIPGSLLGKALTAQAIFDGKFVSPAPPTAPDYYLIPSDNQVTVVWRPSLSETTADPYFSASKSAANYDPNYREFDVAGYRVYRGTRGDAASLRLLAQFDILGDQMVDSTGQINQIDAQGFTTCSPFDGVFGSCVSAGTTNGVPLIRGRTVTLDGPVIQNQAYGVSAITGNIRAVVTKSDTAITGGNSRRPALSGTGVPYIFVDRAGSCEACGVRNHTRYFYIVSAFDLNSIRSGPSSLESNLNGAKSIIPTPLPSNLAASGALSDLKFVGSQGPVTVGPVPTVDGSGRFSGPFPPANGAGMAFIGSFPAQLFNSPGTVTAELRSLTLGDARNGVPATYTFHFTAATGDTTNVTFSIQQELNGELDADGGIAEAKTPPIVFAQPAASLLTRYGVPLDTRTVGQITTTIPSYQPAIAWGRGCADGAMTPPTGFSDCGRNGPRWFEGANETLANPGAGNTGSGTTNFNNAGQLTGVTTIYTPHSFLNVDNDWRNIEATLGGAIRAADFELTWGANGKIAGIVDLTHDVPVPFDATELGGGFGILTQQNSNAAGSPDGRPGVLTVGDFSCVEPNRSGSSSPGWQGRIPCSSAAAFPVTDSVTLGPIAIHNGTVGNLATAAVRPGQGFAMYLAGHLFVFEMAGALPAAGTVWKLRSYTGTIFRNPTTGAHRFRAVTRPFTAIGSKMQIDYSAVNNLAAATNRDLRQVHTVPDPYYVTNSLEASADAKIIKFVNMPDRAIIRIYTVSGVLVRALEHSSTTSSEVVWDVRNRNGQFVASGVYFYHIEALNARRVGRMTIVNFAK